MNHRLVAATLFALLLPSSGAFAQESDEANEVVVIGTRTARPLKDSPVPVRIVDRREIEAAGDVTAADAMTRVVGVTVDTAVRTGQTPQIQGFGSKHVLVLIDGRPAAGRLTDDFDLSRIPASAIERIEVLKGASSVLYGSDAIGGVINIVTRRPRPGLHAGVRVQHDSLKRDEAQMWVSGGNDTVTARLSGTHQIGDAYDLNPDDVATTGNAYERNYVQLDVVGKISDEWELTTTFAGDEATSNGIALGAGNSVIDMQTKGVGSAGRVGARYRPSATSQVRLDVGEARRTYKLRDDQRGGDASDRSLDSKETTQDAALIGSIGYLGTQETTLGVEASQQDLEYNQIGDDAKERERNSVFVQHEWKVVPPLALVPGVRYDRDSQFDGHTSKAIALRYARTPTTIIRLGYGEGYRAPSFSELYLNFANAARGYRVEGNDQLEPETSRSYQASVAWQPTPSLWASLGIFDNDVEDLIINVRTGAMPNLVVRYDNAESVRNRGVETSGRFRVHERVVLGMDYMFLEARDEERDRALDGRAMHSGAVQARYDLTTTGFNAAFTMNLVGKRPYYTDNRGIITTDWSKAYRSANLRLAQKVGDAAEVFAGGRNLTNEGQELYNPVAPRSYFGGVGATF